jgi:hypothetical protein
MARAAGGGGIEIDYEAARVLLMSAFAKAESAVDSGAIPDVGPGTTEAAERLFATNVQAYREALLGCALARRLNSAVNVRLLYVSHGPDAFNGRTLDERVVNPFLKNQEVPSSKGP